MTLGQKIEEKIFKVLMIIATYFILAVLAVIIYSILKRGSKPCHGKSLHKSPRVVIIMGKVVVS